MSQYGAYGRAKKGKSAEQILQHYYTGARVAEASMPAKLRVGLLPTYGGSTAAVGFTSQVFSGGVGKITLKVSGSEAAVAEGVAGDKWRVEASGTGGLRVYKNGTKINRDGVTVFGDPTHPLIIKYAKFDSMLDPDAKAANYPYGRAELGTYQSTSCESGYCARLTLSITMQKYLYGLGEVPSSWPAATLRAQAIAGRTYAYSKSLASQHRYPCDCAVYDSTIDQAYIGDAKRTGGYWEQWKGAVDDTNDQVVLYQGKPISALYSSSSGGHTEHNENVWGGAPLPYLRGVPDAADYAGGANPNFTWSVEMTYATFKDMLEKAYKIGTFESFDLLRPFGISGRVTMPQGDGGGARIVGTTGTVHTSGWSLRSALGLKDTLFRVHVSEPTGGSGRLTAP